MKLATGYFNLTQEYMNTITSNCLAQCSVLMAHPNVQDNTILTLTHYINSFIPLYYRRTGFKVRAVLLVVFQLHTR